MMARTIDQIRASKLPSNMMQFAARGALQDAGNLEVLRSFQTKIPPGPNPAAAGRNQIERCKSSDALMLPRLSA